MDSIFVNPIPIIWTILGRGDNYDSDNDFSGNYVCAKRNSMIAKKLKKVSLIDLMTEDRINKFLSKYNGYAAHVYDWSFEHLKDTKESKYVISVLDALSLRRPNIECQGGRELHEDSCAGIFKYKSDKGFKGHAYCAYNHVATIVSPPFECTPLTIISKNATYIAAHISPYIGEFGGGIDGLYCLIPAAYNQKNIEIIRMVFSESKLGLTVASKMKSDNMTMFFGASKFKPSKILKHTFEYTTATFSATNNQGSIEVSGSIVLTVSAQNLDEQKSFLQPSNKQIEQYSTQVIDDLNIRFHKYYKKNNICDNSVIF
jgi:hypothetical protein